MCALCEAVHTQTSLFLQPSEVKLLPKLAVSQCVAL